MRAASLGSGSRGNALVVEAAGVRVLVDCGFSHAETVRRLQTLGLSPADLDAVLVSHEHGDHCRGVRALVGRHGLPVWATAGTAGCLDLPPEAELHVLSPDVPFSIGSLRIHPYPVPHDAREPCQFVFEAAGLRLGVLTDAGHCTPHMGYCLQDLDGLVLECNHDPDMLACGPYPPALRRRVGGDYGHLSNAQAARLLAAVASSRLAWVVAAHLSEQNNTPEAARAALADVLPGSAELRLADQTTGFSWQELG